MSTRVTNVHGHVLRLFGDEGENVGLSLAQSAMAAEVDAPFNRAEFLAAVAAECGVIIIDRADLPKVRITGGNYATTDEHDLGCFGDNPTEDAAWHRRAAYAELALADYMDAHPPVDEADVTALVNELGQMPANLFALADDGYYETVQRDIARRLLATGRVEVKR